MNAVQSRRPGTFKQFVNTGDEKNLNLQSNQFEGSRARGAQSRLDSRLDKKSWDL